MFMSAIKINMKDAILFISKAWDDVKSKTTNNKVKKNELFFKRFYHISSLIDPL